MRVLILQISDIHIHDENDVILTRAEAMVQAVRGLDYELDGCVVAITGDIANVGGETQFLLGMDFLAAIQQKLSQDLRPSVDVSIVAIPGNHDCDFSASQNARDIIIDSLKHKSPDAIDTGIVEICTGVQAQFFGLRDAMCGQPLRGDRLYYEYEYRKGQESILFRCLNTAWVSRLRDTPGLVFPPTKIPDTETTNTVTIALMHHPFEWFTPDNRRELRRRIERTTDIVLTGHEHVHTRRVQETSTGELNEFIEAPALQERAAPEVSSFNAILIDSGRSRQKVVTLTWDGEIFAPSPADPQWEEFQVNRQRQQREFEVAPAFQAFLEDLGVTVHHIDRGVVRLPDLFVMPDFQTVATQSEGVGTTVSGASLFELAERRSHLLLTGVEQAGKTSVAKMLFGHLKQNGFVPLYIDGASFLPRYDDRLIGALFDKFSEQYCEGMAERFRQLEPSRRAIIIDNFHLLRIDPKREEQFYGLLERFAEHIVVLANDLEHHFNEIGDTRRRLEDRPEYESYRILPFGHAKRGELAERWFLLKDGVEYESEELARLLLEAERRMKLVIGRNFIPPYPVFLVSLLQAQETTTDVDLRASSYGYYYELLIRNALAVGSSHVQFNIKTAYLSHLAFELFCRGRISEFGRAEMEEIHGYYESRYDLKLHFGALIADFERCHLIDHIDDTYWFRYKYVEYYFVAHYISQHLSEEPIRDLVKKIAANLSEDAANVLLFLTHLSRDPLIIEQIVGKARTLFAEVDAAALDEDVRFVTAVGEDLELTYVEKPVSIARRERLADADKSDYDDPPQGPQDRAEMDASYEEAQRHAARMGEAFRSMQVMGQILKNFPGSLDGGIKLELAAECYHLGLRTLNSILRVLEAGREDLIEAFAAMVREDNPSFAPEEVRRRARRSLFGLTHAICFGMVQRVAYSVGGPDLAPTYKRVREANPTVATALIDVSLKMEQSVATFPRQEVIRLGEEIDGKLLPATLLRHLVVNHFYLFPVEIGTKQAVCTKLGISYQRIQAPDPKRRMIRKN